ncbi:hypothetical protein H181DRAFT_00904 [Streptomyces sp. WMMB 714]|jgi:hypothetical protein|nr:hypothetical protein H181DRAFT_00904 [Streptomyces sp. WMMB 714]
MTFTTRAHRTLTPGPWIRAGGESLKLVEV